MDCEFFIRRVAYREGCKIYELHVAVDHIHLFVELPPTMSISKALQLFKGYSAFCLLQKHPWLRNYFRKGHFWSPGKFFRSVGNTTTKPLLTTLTLLNLESICDCICLFYLSDTSPFRAGFHFVFNIPI